MRLRATLAVLLLLPAAPVASQVQVRTEPAVPVRGTLFRLEVTPEGDSQVASIGGNIGGEPLHLWTSDGVTWKGLGAAPIDLSDSLLPLQLVLTRADVTDTVAASIALGAGDYPSERLRVAPGMAEPDSAALRRISREGAEARAVGRLAHTTPRLWEAPFEAPRVARQTSAFGTARMYNGKVTSRHMGTDFAGAVGAPIRAANRGRVALVAHFYLAGHVVYLDHGEGLVSAYFHLSRTRVKVGDVVERGQIIGEVGQSGRVTGPHLHWVMRYGSTTVDPMSVLTLLGAADSSAGPSHTP